MREARNLEGLSRGELRLRIEGGVEVIYDGSLADFDAGKLQTA